jgi:hypothetical protein
MVAAAASRVSSLNPHLPHRVTHRVIARRASVGGAEGEESDEIGHSEGTGKVQGRYRESDEIGHSV